MNADIQSLRDDLAFMRTLLQAGEDNYRPLGEGYLLGGLVYGGEMLLHLGQIAGLVPATLVVSVIVGAGPTAIFIAGLVFLLRRHGATMPASGGLTTKAIRTAFAAIGISVLALIAVIGAVAIREQSLTVWLIFPCTVFVLQGTAWLLAFLLRRHSWQGVIAAGWFATGIAMAIFVTRQDIYILLAGVGLLGFMALPGYLMLRYARSLRDGCP
jgi:hypothetical protein